jgi:AraC-like DNA-binding protein
VRPRRSREQLRQALREALHERPSPSVAEVARRLGYAKPYWLYTVDAALCRQITRKYRRPGRIDWWRKRGIKSLYALAQVKKILEDYLSAQGRIPPLHRIAVSLGYANDMTIRLQFPELRRALSAKIARQRAERAAAIGSALEQAIQENPPPNLREICRRVGFSSSNSLMAYAPVLYARLVAHRRVYAKVSRAELRNKLKAALSEIPPHPSKDVYTRIGVTTGTARRNFPELHRAIVVRHWRFRHQQARARQEVAKREASLIVRRLHEQGICPSVPRVRSLLKTGSVLNWTVVGEVVNNARKALGIN